MPPINWDHRFFTTTRGQLLTLLRKSRQTVDDLASALSVSDNAVRNHLYALERDGFVTHEGVRRGVGKPAWVYRLTPAAERLFPKPYASVLDTLLGVLSERMSRKDVDAALVEVGKRLATTVPRLTGTVEERMPAVIDVLADLGGLAELDTSDHTIIVRGYDCPISSAVRSHPDACRVLESLLETVLGTPVEEHCDRGNPPRCCFAVPVGTPPETALQVGPPADRP
jgi:predicted ArsR family transcriptional regulator